MHLNVIKSSLFWEDHESFILLVLISLFEMVLRRYLSHLGRVIYVEVVFTILIKMDVLHTKDCKKFAASVLRIKWKTLFCILLEPERGVLKLSSIYTCIILEENWGREYVQSMCWNVILYVKVLQNNWRGMWCCVPRKALTY